MNVFSPEQREEQRNLPHREWEKVARVLVGAFGVPPEYNFSYGNPPYAWFQLVKTPVCQVWMPSNNGNQYWSIEGVLDNFYFEGYYQRDIRFFHVSQVSDIGGVVRAHIAYHVRGIHPASCNFYGEEEQRRCGRRLALWLASLGETDAFEHTVKSFAPLTAHEHMEWGILAQSRQGLLPLFAF